VVIDVSYIPLQGEAVPSRRITEPIKVTGPMKYDGNLAKAKAGTMLNQNTITMTCAREAAKAKVVEGVYGKSTVYPGGMMTINTNAKSVSVSLPSKVEGPGCAPQPVVFSEPEKSHLCRGCLSYGDVLTDQHSRVRTNHWRLDEYERVC